jgi:hypothetical protein
VGSDDDDDSGTPPPTGLTVREGASQLGQRTLPTRAEARRLDRGEAIGRYLVVDVVGEGGMGVVYACYDPELDRKVAIKLLQARPDGDDSRGQAWLLREAQAMARLQHPNVLAVHDVGTLGGDRVFVAMELVDGSTLRAWLRAGKRTWRDVLPVMRAAGAGLAAAHAAGLVHRDFKPDNVLVGKDGRARVMDFGLARLRAEAGETVIASRDSDLAIPVPVIPSSAASGSIRLPLAEQLTDHGTIAGTPAYMAPELHRGSQADARSDQFAFGVALYEALYGVRPYDKAQLSDAKATPIPRTPPAIDAPSRLARAVMRAIAADPATRFSSMDALLGDLADEPRRSPVALVVGAGALVAAAGIAIVVAASGRGDPRAPVAPVDPCADAADRLHGVWDDGVRAATRTAFDATRSPLAAAGYASVARELDRYAAAWTDAATDSCRATRVRGEQPEDAMALRAACLDERRDELRAFAALLAKADAATVEKAGHAAASLESLAQCANVAELRAPGAPPAAAHDQLVKLRDELATAKAARLAGKTADALAAATIARDHAIAIGWAPIVAEAHLVRGLALQTANQAPDAQDEFVAGATAAIAGRRDDVAAEAALWAAQNAAEGLGKDGDARAWLAVGSAFVQRTGDRLLDAQRLQVAGVVAGVRGDWPAARAAHEEALAAANALANPDAIAIAENALAATLSKAGDYAKARPHLEHALQLREAEVGKDHPDVAVVLTNLGACYQHAGDNARGRQVLERALAIREAAFGATSPRLIATLNNLADLEWQDGEAADAAVAIERAYKLASVAPGSAHPLFHIVATTRGQVMLAQGKPADAAKALDAVLALEDAAKSPVLSTTLAARGDVALAMSAWADAAAFDARAIAIVEAASGKDSPELWRPLAGLARAKAGLGDRAAARVAARRAVAIGRAAQVTDAALGDALALAN